MQFAYRFIDRKGKKKWSALEAFSLADAKEKLYQSGTYVIEIREKKGREKRERNFSQSNLIVFTTQLSHLLDAGVPLYESLLSLREQYRQERFSHIIEHLCEQIKAGTTLSQAMRAYPRSFNQLYTSMIEAGESVGVLSETLGKLSCLLQKQSKLKKQILTALLYPLILTVFSTALIIVLLTFVVPSLEVLFEGQEVNRFTRFVFGISHVITQGWMVGLSLLVGGGTALYFLFKRWKRKWQEFVLRIPLVKTVITQTAVARFCRTMGTLLEGGVTIISALQISRHVMRQPVLEEAIEEAEKRIIEGSILSQELAKSPWFPPLVPRMLAIGEEGGNVGVMLGKIAELYEEEVEKVLTRLTALAQPVILVLLGGIVGFIMMAILLPLTDVSGFLSGGM
ncbi:MAG: type II secretion system F family protein [Chlamydiales bacterium]|nr:type II secretion system F family protein [Chlamydiales bacterium]